MSTPLQVVDRPRLGGDAFLAILPHTDESGAATFAEALRGQIVERPLKLSIGETRVSVSTGSPSCVLGMELSDNQVPASVEEALASARQTADGDASARLG